MSSRLPPADVRVSTPDPCRRAACRDADDGVPRAADGTGPAPVTCRTCTGCRSRKVKCNGQQPSCSACRARGHPCEYPQDGRRTAARTRTAKIRTLQGQVQALRQQVARHAPHAEGPEIQGVTEPHGNSSPLYASSHQQEDVVSATGDEPRCSRGVSKRPGTSCPRTDSGASVSQAAGGNNLPVYGPTSLLHNSTTAHLWESPQSTNSAEDAATSDMARNALVGRAALSMQRESVLYSTPSAVAQVDFDGVSPDLAMHFMDLHWNRWHLFYLVTYRPAVMDSLFTNGPYVNKLLLNAIYLQSCLYSDRHHLCPDPHDRQSKGMPFYSRFKALLADYIDQPSIPTVAALLITGACLVPYGLQSAAWVYCGMAYRMLFDLGCHLEAPTSSRTLGVGSALSTSDAEVRRRLYWGAYACDKLQSQFLGRAPALRVSESNVSQDYLDSFEELEVWRPYADPEGHPRELIYHGRPSYAVTTFEGTLRLTKIMEQIVDHFYSVQTAMTPLTELFRQRDHVREQLAQWQATLPVHLRYDPATDPTPPPHQISLHATYWTLVILVEQALLTRISSDSATDGTANYRGRSDCLDAAFRIWRLLEAYYKAFTFRNAEYALFYTAYSAALILLKLAPEEDGQYVECIHFFWIALSNHQPSNECGLRKPFAVLKSLISQIKKLAQHIDCGEPDTNAGGPPSHPYGTALPDQFEVTDTSLSDMNSWLETWAGSLTEDSFLMDNAIFGLFTD